MSPFKNFLCPSTNEVIKDSVVLESSQNYERTAIEYWFLRCIEDQDPTCPIMGQVLKSTEMKPNIGLTGAIEEWVSRNIEIQLKSTMQCLSEDQPLVDYVEWVLDVIYKILELKILGKSNRQLLWGTTINNTNLILRRNNLHK